MVTSQKIHKAEDSDLKQLIQFISRNYKVFIICIGVAIGLACLANRFMKPYYKISASLLIAEETKATEGSVDEFLKSNLFGSNRNLQNELWVLKSAPVLEQMIRNLNLAVNYYQKGRFQYVDSYGKMPFRVSLVQNHIQPVNVRFRIFILDQDHYTLTAEGKNVSFMNMDTGEVDFIKKKWNFKKQGRFGAIMETSDLAFAVELGDKNDFNNDLDYNFMLKEFSIVSENIKKNLSFKIVDKLATVIEVIYKCPSVKKGKDIVNEMMNVYSQQNLDRKKHIARIAIDYIGQQLNEISDSLRFAEDNLQTFRSSNQLLNFTEQATGITTQYMNLEDKLAELQTRKRYYDYVADYLSKNEDFSKMIVPASMGIPDQLLNNLMSELISAQAQLSNLIRNNQELNPQVQKLGIEIDVIKKAISENITAVRKTTDMSVEEMIKRIDETKATISRLPETQRRLGSIERRYKLNDAIFNYLLEKRAEAKITLAIDIPDNMIIEHAKVVNARPVFPNEKVNYLIALFLGLAVPFGSLTMKNVLNNKIESQETVEHITNLPIVGKIMHHKRRNGNRISGVQVSITSESYRTLRTNLECQFKGLQRKVILVTSCIEGEGKSLTALNLAKSYAQLGHRTLLMNFDLRKPTQYFKGQEKSLNGISYWYTNDCELNDLIMHSPDEKLDFIQSGPIPVNPTELLSLNKTGTLLNQLKTIYDCIILDTSPLALVCDTYLLTDHADIKIVIVRYNYTIRKVFALIMKELAQKGIRNVCIVMNDNRIYNDQYGYGYGYRKGNNASPVQSDKQLINYNSMLKDQVKQTL